MCTYTMISMQTLASFFKKKWANPASFLFIFVLFKNNLYRKTVGVSGIRTRIVGVEGEHADHLTTTTAQRWHLLNWIFSVETRVIFIPVIKVTQQKHIPKSNSLVCFRFRISAAFWLELFESDFCFATFMRSEFKSFFAFRFQNLFSYITIVKMWKIKCTYTTQSICFLIKIVFIYRCFAKKHVIFLPKYLAQ